MCVYVFMHVCWHVYGETGGRYLGVSDHFPFKFLGQIPQ